MKKGLSIGSWLSLAAAVLAAAIVLVGRWAVNAEALGAHDLGLAVSLAFLTGFAFLACAWSAPVFVLAGALALRVHWQAGLRFLAAGVVCAVPLAYYAWIESGKAPNVPPQSTASAAPGASESRSSY